MRRSSTRCWAGRLSCPLYGRDLLVASYSNGVLRILGRQSGDAGAGGCYRVADSGGAVRSGAALWRWGKGFCDALRFAVALRVVLCVLAPLLLVSAAMWQPPAAKEGQGDCDFQAPHCAHSRPVFRAAAQQPHSSRAARDLRGPSLDSPLPLETPPLRCGVGGGGALRFGAALCRWGKGGCGALRSAVALRFLGGILAPLLAAAAAQSPAGLTCTARAAMYAKARTSLRQFRPEAGVHRYARVVARGT